MCMWSEIFPGGAPRIEQFLFQGFMSGQGVAGIFASLAMIISLAVTHGLIVRIFFCFL